MFELSHESLFFDYFRIPHHVLTEERGSDLSDGTPTFCAVARWRSRDIPSRMLFWPLMPNGRSFNQQLLPLARYHVGSIPIYARVVPDAAADAWLAGTRHAWQPEAPVLDEAARRVASVRRDDAGNVFLPFDPGEAMLNYWSEAYLNVDARLHGVRRLAMRSYYRLRPLMPRRLQIGLRRLFSAVQGRALFPRWPVEPALHDFYDLMLTWIAATAGEAVPWLAPWPEGYAWALVLTHDVETDAGVRNIERIIGVETGGGYRSCWNFVPRRYEIPEETLQRLAERQLEVGVHGLFHDGRDLESLRILEERVPQMRRYAARWGATGFRAPATHRVWDWMPLLGFDYDSSYPDTDPYEPQRGGCCTWLPFFNRDLVELPITLPQDHTLFFILGHADERLWVEKASYIRDRGGMALLITHPDYMQDGDVFSSYARLLNAFSDDATAWRALPREVSAWWRRRAATTLERDDGEWRLVGPAAGEGKIVYASVDESSDRSA